MMKQLTELEEAFVRVCVFSRQEVIDLIAREAEQFQPNGAAAHVAAYFQQAIRAMPVPQPRGSGE